MGSELKLTDRAFRRAKRRAVVWANRYCEGYRIICGKEERDSRRSFAKMVIDNFEIQLLQAQAELLEDKGKGSTSKRSKDERAQ